MLRFRGSGISDYKKNIFLMRVTKMVISLHTSVNDVLYTFIFAIKGVG